MAERIVSPGVFTREKDLSFLPQAIGEIGAAIIGPTKKGPAFVPTIVRTFNEFVDMFGDVTKDYYTPYAVEQYLRSAGTVTIVRVLGEDGYSNDIIKLYAISASATRSLAYLAPSAGGASGAGDLSATTIASGNIGSTDSTLVVTGSDVDGYSVNLSFDTGSANYIENVFSYNAQTSIGAGGTAVPVYLYANFKNAQTTLNWVGTEAVSASVDTINFASTDYSNASTPTVQSQMINGSRFNLFKVNTRSHGSNVNDDVYCVVSNVKAAGSIAGSDYGSFSLAVQKVDDGTLIESWHNLSFDATSTNYLPRVVGDRYVTIASDGKLTYNGDWPNMSNHIYISDYSALEFAPKTVVPMGHSALTNTVPGTTHVNAAQLVTSQTSENLEFDTTIPYGFDFNYYYQYNSNGKAHDNVAYLAPTPISAGNGNNVTMSLENMYGHASASATYATGSDKVTLADSHISQRKFALPFQGGFDGMNPATVRNTGNSITSANVMGFDCSSATTMGTTVYKKAINAVSNPDEFDINLLVTPGIVHGLHSKVSSRAMNMVEERGDAFYVMDASIHGESIATVTNRVNTLDTNYVATYYPWVKIVDSGTSLPVWVPPSVVLPGVIAYTDQVSHEWFAPAGLNRGGLTSVVEAQTRLTHAERDDLYEDRVNPIASFPGQGVCVWGQKTLQAKPSALDRVNVRRLLIRLKKFIASSSRYLLFEQNTAGTRNRFLNIVNPFLDSVQANSGLSAFRVVMDESNNTPDVIDRNRLVGQIYIQPTRTAEFIVLDFVVLPTGATFPE
jgi:phage tail sheath protein FI